MSGFDIIVVGSGLFLIWHESRKRRQPPPPAELPE